jgi:hypothetical protein
MRIVAGGDAMPAARAAGHRKALVFTSAGVIGAAVGATLELRDEKTVDLTVASFNASVTELELAAGPAKQPESPAGGGWTLRTFNTTPHLRESRLITRI